MTATFCPGCGAQIPDDARLCAGCGAARPGTSPMAPPADPPHGTTRDRDAGDPVQTWTSGFWPFKSTITLHPNRIVYTTVGAPELVIALRQVEAVEAPLWPRSRNFVRIRTGGKVHDLFVRGKGPEVRGAISAALP